ncbi:MAG: response regulator [Chloroflexi bacterium]|nr:response regulator [Chloroflexota bacterium]
MARWHTRCTVSRGWRSPIRVLIAEDDAHVRALVEQVVAELGHTTCCASDGAHALRLYDAHGADVVISDWMMPGLDGVQLCREVRARAGAPYTYFILLTALGDMEHRLAGMQAGVDDYVGKPFSIDDLEARMIAAQRVTVVHRRQEQLLRMARQFAAEADPARLVDELLQEAIELVEGAAGVVTRWDTERRMLVLVASTAPVLGALELRLGEGASGRAAQTRAPVLLNGAEDRLDPVLRRAHMRSAVAVPLLHQGRLVGALAIGKDASPGARVFTSEDVELLDMLATTGASALVALEHARLDGVLLAARTAQHELNNQLAVARGYAEMLTGSPDLPPHLRDIAGEVMSAADNAAGILRQLRNISTVREQRWRAPSDTTINLLRSQGPAD